MRVEVLRVPGAGIRLQVNDDDQKCLYLDQVSEETEAAIRLVLAWLLDDATASVTCPITAGS